VISPVVAKRKRKQPPVSDGRGWSDVSVRA
jgi:hypothetical protein